MLRFFIPYYESFSVKQEEEKKLIFFSSIFRKKIPISCFKSNIKKDKINKIKYSLKDNLKPCYTYLCFCLSFPELP